MFQKVKLLSLVMLVTACGAAKFASKKHSSPGAEPAPAAQIVTPDVAAAPVFSLEGTWKTDCIVFGENHSVMTIVFKENVRKTIYALYSDAGCMNVFEVERSEATFEIVGDMPGLDSTKSVNSVLTKETFEFSTDELVSTANASAIYGFKDWVLNQPKEITGLKWSDADQPDDPIGTRYFGIAKIVDGSPKEYIPGDAVSGDGSTEEKRPKSLDPSFVAKKQ